MFLLKLEELAWRYRRLLIVLIVVIVIQVLELILLHFKYGLFTGGFLQPFAYQTISERITFVLLSLWFDLAFYGLLASLWFFVADKLSKSGITVYYYFTVFVVLLVGGGLGIKFKLLSYFSDTINLQIIKNLGGGTIAGAISYASNEIALFAGAIAVVILGVVLTLKMLSKNNLIQRLLSKEGVHSTYVILLTTMAIVTPVMAYFTSNNDFFRYGLKKKIAYQLITDGLDRLSDFDLDGVGIFSYPKDKAPFNASIYPGALDIPGDGIDQDGFLGDAQLLDANQKDTLTEITPHLGKHIVLVVLESTRADIMEQQVNDQYVAPKLRSIASQGTSIPYAYSHTGYTTTSLKAIFNRQLFNSNSKMTLVKFLRAAGYQMSVISGQDESFGDIAKTVGTDDSSVNFFDARSAIDDRIFPSKDPGSLKLSEERLIEQFNLRLKQIDFSKPQFFYINIQAGHFPYVHPKLPRLLSQNLIPRSEITPANKDWLAETYWNAMANADWALGEIVTGLKGASLFDKTTLVVLGDHGESLFDDGFLGHGHLINDTQTKIPLVINDPNIKLGDQAIGQTDVAEILLRSALGEKNYPISKNKQVFQVVGSLAQPILCAHVGQGGVRTTFDFRSEMFFFSDLNSWKSYQDVLVNPQLKGRAVNLIHEWESLRWQESLAK